MSVEIALENLLKPVTMSIHMMEKVVLQIVNQFFLHGLVLEVQVRVLIAAYQNMETESLLKMNNVMMETRMTLMAVQMLG